MKTKLYVYILLCASFAALFQACEKQSADTENIVYRLKWLMNSGAAGSLFANANGYFHEQGLKVTIRPGGVEHNAITELEMGRAQFGVASGDQIIRALEKGAPICVIAQLFQKSPLCWMYYKNRHPFHSLQDLKGKTIGITFGNEDETIMRALLKKAGLKPEKDVSFYSVRYDYTPFYTGKVDLWPVYRNSNGVIIQEKLKSANETIGFFSPHDHDIAFVGNSVISTQKMISENPSRVKKFCKALLKGWQAVLSEKNRDQAVSIIQGFDKGTKKHLIVKQMTSSRALMIPENNQPVGIINPSVWKQTEHCLLEQNIIKKPVLNQTNNVFFYGGTNE